MNERERAARAAHNNARWCDTVCRAWGAPGEFRPALWLNRHTVPPFYSNAVTLAAAAAGEQLAAVADLAAERATFSVKDSFAALDLRPLGFDVLFEAQWMWREPAAPPPVADGGPDWSIVDTPDELALWEAAWAGLHEGGVPETERIFRPPLLAEPGFVFLAGRRDGRITAVAAANRSGDEVGLSNVFSPSEEMAVCWAGVVAFAGELFPGRPLVGYERGDDLAAAFAAGFQPVAPLRVWAR